MSRTCPHCKENKTSTEFYSKSGVEGASSYCKVCTNLQTTVRAKALKERAVNYKGGCCQSCGYSKCLAALEFHHTDPEEKDFTVSENKGRSFDNIKQELDKCVLLCANCHREAHVKNTKEWAPTVKEEAYENVELDSYQKPKAHTKIDWPSDTDLHELVWKYPRSHLAKVLKVSDVAIAKYLKRRGITQPPRGYWAKVKR